MTGKVQKIEATWGLAGWVEKMATTIEKAFGNEKLGDVKFSLPKRLAGSNFYTQCIWNDRTNTGYIALLEGSELGNAIKWHKASPYDDEDDRQRMKIIKKLKWPEAWMAGLKKWLIICVWAVISGWAIGHLSRGRCAVTLHSLLLIMRVRRRRRRSRRLSYAAVRGWRRCGRSTITIALHWWIFWTALHLVRGPARDPAVLAVIELQDYRERAGEYYL